MRLPLLSPPGLSPEQQAFSGDIDTERCVRRLWDKVLLAEKPELALPSPVTTYPLDAMAE